MEEILTWGRESLEEITAQFEGALLEVGLQDSRANVFAYGENRTGYDSETGETASCGFGAMQTDFNIWIEVEDIGDHDALGNQLALVLEVLEDFPYQQLPGSLPGIVFIWFMDGVRSLSW